MEIIYKSFNQYNYDKIALKINEEEKTATIYKGGACPISYDKKTTAKHIRELIELYRGAGFTIKEA